MSESFLDFVRRTDPKFVIGPHHEKVAEAFDRLIDGDLRRLIVCLPPRFSKTSLTQFLVAYAAEKMPSSPIAYVAETSTQAAAIKRHVAALCPPVKHLCAAMQFIGIGAKILPAPALLVFDDIHWHYTRMAQEEIDAACSRADEKMRTLRPVGRALVICSRLNADDFPGRLIRTGGWEVVSIPALLPNGESSWPGVYPADALLKLKQDFGLRTWEAWYQQNPIPEVANV